MNKEEIFSIWAPSDSPWSRWAKPVLFAHHDPRPAEAVGEDLPCEMSAVPTMDERVAIVADLPGAEGVRVGIELARRGYRPVPLYNAIPVPFEARVLHPNSAGFVAAVDVLPIVRALAQDSLRLAEIQLPPDAPPVFLLDSNRQGDGRPMRDGDFDNHSVCFTTDFPSANFLHAHGIEGILLMQRSRILPMSDLSHILRRWQEGGLKLELIRVDSPDGRRALEVARPSWYGVMFQRVLLAMGLKRAGMSGFGAFVAPSGG
jgi:hypothetical protein